MNRKWIILLIILTAALMRAPLTGIGALVNTIAHELDLSPGQAGALTTIPLVFFGVFSPVVTGANKRLGAGRVLTCGAVFLCAGILIRSFGGYYGLFIGVGITGIGITVGNVMLPGIIKTFFPDRIEAMTGMYTALMQAVSAVSTAVSVPLAYRYGWEISLFVWFGAAVCALAVCIANRLIRTRDDGAEERPSGSQKRFLKSPMAWWVSCYMGAQSLIFYSFIAWLSPILKGRGYEVLSAGYILSLYVIMGILGSCILPLIMKKNKSQSSTGIQLGVLYLIGLMLFFFFHSGILLYVGILLCGFCSGLCISFAMTLFGFHTGSGSDATMLSGMGQSAGYLIAAVGPLLLGQLYDMTGSWTQPLSILLGICVFLIIAGYVVGRERLI